MKKEKYQISEARMSELAPIIGMLRERRMTSGEIVREMGILGLGTAYSAFASLIRTLSAVTPLYEDEEEKTFSILSEKDFCGSTGGFPWKK